MPKKKLVQAFGQVFDSQSEVKFHALLLEAKNKGLIEFDEVNDRQVPVDIYLNAIKVTRYTVDFLFKAKGSLFIIEVKGFMRSRDAVRVRLLKAHYKNKAKVMLWHDSPRLPIHHRKNEEILNIIQGKSL